MTVSVAMWGHICSKTAYRYVPTGTWYQVLPSTLVTVLLDRKEREKTV